MRKGLSLVEALVGLAILAVVGLAVLGALSSSAREMKTTSEYSLSLFIIQKVAEELVQGGYENPRADQALEELAGNRLDLENPLNPYFATVEDSVADFGVMETGRDVAVEPTTGPLHRLYRDFNLTLTTSDSAVGPGPGDPEIIKLVNIQYDWPGIQQNPRDLSFPLILAKSCIQPMAPPPITEDAANLEPLITRAVYPRAPAGSVLSTLVGSTGASLPAVKDLGTVMVVTYLAYRDMSTMQQGIDAIAAQQAASSPPDPELDIRMGREHERKAALAWQSLYHCRDPARRLSTAFTAGDLGDLSLVEPVVVHSDVSRATLLEQWFEFELSLALRCYVTARSRMASLSPRPYRLLMLERKILELAELQAMAAGSPDVAFVGSWSDSMLDIYVGRNRAMADFFARERSHAGSLQQIRDAHPEIRDRLEDTELGRQALQQLQTRVTTELF